MLPINATGIAVEWTFRIGDLIVTAAFLLTILVHAIRIGRFIMRIEVMEKNMADEIMAIEKRFQGMEKSQELIADALKTIAVQSSQLERLEQDMKDLRRGEGFIGVEIIRKIAK